MSDRGRQETHVIVAPTGWSEDKLQYRRHHLARYLVAERGAEVVWVYPLAVKPGKLLSQPLEVRQCADGVVEAGVPDFKGLVQNLGLLQRKVLEGFADLPVLGAELYLWFTCPVFGELSHFKWKGIYYDCSDWWSEAGDRRFIKGLLFRVLKKPLIEKSEGAVVRAAEAVTATSSYLQQRLQKRYGVKVAVVENGVDYELFQREVIIGEPAWSGQGEATLGFVGGMKSWKIDFALLAEIAEARPEWNLVLIGPYYGEQSDQFTGLVALDNVYWVELVQPRELPGYLNRFDLGLLPYLENSYNRGVFPLKLYEYLACGLPVVGCGLPSTEGRVEEGLYVHTAGRAEAVTGACEQALKWEGYLEKRREAAKGEDWQEKFKALPFAVRGGGDSG